MVERVARAIFLEKTGDIREAARAAIAAMRKPTEAMQKAGFASDVVEVKGDWPADLPPIVTNVGAAWQAMIDEALK